MKRIRNMIWLTVLCGLLCGCAIKTGDELLSAPKPTTTYAALTEKTDALKNSGCLESAPEVGQNLTSVQLVDLDGDKEKEAITFFRKSDTSNQFFANIYKKVNNKYVLLGALESGDQDCAGISSVLYPKLAKGLTGVLIGWKVDDTTTSLSLGVLQDGKVSEILSQNVSCTSFIAPDMTDDGYEELITFKTHSTPQKDTADSAEAELYYYDGAKMKSGGSPLLLKSSTISNVATGRTADVIGEDNAKTGSLPAVFVDEAQQPTGFCTDILVWNEQELRSLTGNYDTIRPIQVYAADIDGDGIKEVPTKGRDIQGASGINDGQSPYLIDWYAYGSNGRTAQPVSTTYTDLTEEWQLKIPRDYAGSITVKQAGYAERAVTIFSLPAKQQAAPSPEQAGTPAATSSAATDTSIEFLKIYCLTGDRRSEIASKMETMGNVINLKKTDTVIYEAEILSGAAQTDWNITAIELMQDFSVVEQGWNK